MGNALACFCPRLQNTHCTTTHLQACLSKVFTLEDWRDSSVVRSTGYCSRFNSPTPTRWLTTFCDSSSRGSDSIFWPLSASGMYMVHIHRCRQTHKINKPFKEFNFVSLPKQENIPNCSTPQPENPSDTKSTGPRVSAHPRAQ